MAKWVNHHRGYFSKDGYVMPGMVFELPDGETPPPLSVLADSPEAAPPKPNTVAAPSTMSEVAKNKKHLVADDL